MEEWQKDQIETQSINRLFREGQTSAVLSSYELPSINTDLMIKNMLKAKGDMKKIGPIYSYCLCPRDVRRKIEEYAHSVSTSMPLYAWKTFCGIDIQTLDGLYDELLMFETSRDMKSFLDVVDDNRTLMFLTQDEAVKRAIGFFKFLGKIIVDEKEEFDMRDKFVKVNDDYEDKQSAGHVYRVTGESKDTVTIEDGSLSECYSIKKDECKVIENYKIN